MEPAVQPVGKVEEAAAPASSPTMLLPGRMDRLVPLAVASALLMEFIDSTALSTALPSLARAFTTDPIHLKLALTSYLLALAVFAPASGWTADRFGARRVFTAAMAIFLGGSIFCALSRTLEELVLGRIVQGMGGAMMTPVGRLIIVELSPKAKLVGAMVWFTTPALIGPILGPPLAGLILGIGPWPWIFLINVPIGLAGMIAVNRLVPAISRPDPGAFDWRGFGLVSLGIVSLVATAETVGLGLVPPWVQISGAATTLAALTLYWRYSGSHARPVLDLELLRYQTFRTGLLGGLLIRLGLGATPFLLPLLLQTGLGWSPTRAGLVMIATGVGALSARSTVSLLIKRYGFKRMLIGSGVGAAVLTAVPGLFDRSTSIAAIVLTLAVTGFVRSMQFTSTNSIIYAEVPEERVSAASTFATVVQQVGMSLGVTTGALALALTRPSLGGLTSESFLLPFLVVGAISLLAAPIYFRLPSTAGSEISGAGSGAALPHPHV